MRPNMEGATANLDEGYIATMKEYVERELRYETIKIRAARHQRDSTRGSKDNDDSGIDDCLWVDATERRAVEEAVIRGYHKAIRKVVQNYCLMLRRAAEAASGAPATEQQEPARMVDRPGSETREMAVEEGISVQSLEVTVYLPPRPVSVQSMGCTVEFADDGRKGQGPAARSPPRGHEARVDLVGGRFEQLAITTEKQQGNQTPATARSVGHPRAPSEPKSRGGKEVTGGSPSQEDKAQAQANPAAHSVQSVSGAWKGVTRVAWSTPAIDPKVQSKQQQTGHSTPCSSQFGARPQSSHASGTLQAPPTRSMAAPVPNYQQWSVGPPPPLPPSDLPPFFYRVQHFDSTSYQYPDGEFESACYYERFNRYLNRYALMRHLDWNNRSPTSFISVFDNKEDAMNRAQMHLNWNHRNVRVCKINTQPLQPQRVRCRQGMPVWATDSSLKGCFFFSTQEARRYLGLPYHLGQRSEWFAVNFIPAEMVTVDTFWDWRGQMHTRPDDTKGWWYGDAQAGNSRPVTPMYW